MSTSLLPLKCRSKNNFCYRRSSIIQEDYYRICKEWLRWELACWRPVASKMWTMMFANRSLWARGRNQALSTRVYRRPWTTIRRRGQWLTMSAWPAYARFPEPRIKNRKGNKEEDILFLHALSVAMIPFFTLWFAILDKHGGELRKNRFADRPVITEPF